jgi:hypothetical protein
MRIDDIVSDIVARNAPYVAALSTGPVPLTTLVAGNFKTRDLPPAIQGPVTVFVDAALEEMVEEAPSFRIVRMPVDIIVFAIGSTEAVMREQARNYAQAILDCLRAGNANFFNLTAREDFDGVEGKPDIKATRMNIAFMYEEAL